MLTTPPDTISAFTSADRDLIIDALWQSVLTSRNRINDARARNREDVARYEESVFDARVELMTRLTRESMVELRQAQLAIAFAANLRREMADIVDARA